MVLPVIRKAFRSSIHHQWKRIERRNLMSAPFFSSLPSSYSTSPSYYNNKERNDVSISRCNIQKLRKVSSPSAISVRLFQNEASFHCVADETLETIQDELDCLFEDNLPQSADFPEINYAAGVLTMILTPHGAWVMNKQTPNRQIWWSSPISGPRRYEWDEEEEVWVNTKYADAVLHFDGMNDEDRQSFEGDITLGDVIKKEIKQLYSLTIPELDI
uniref:Ferroxidase n=1 Tax=Eucampia antarctica TaxID=49252 RepID=A0A7S2RM44_9STRA|mmetsp:Transcript_23617/g.22647  ORF Transcript_23617/g.22647 Transcript_23617/m.22647 type:complete len:216 (+) Transcript_23617:61-708(+)